MYAVIYSCNKINDKYLVLIDFISSLYVSYSALSVLSIVYSAIMPSPSDCSKHTSNH